MKNLDYHPKDAAIAAALAHQLAEVDLDFDDLAAALAHAAHQHVTKEAFAVFRGLCGLEPSAAVRREIYEMSRRAILNSPAFAAAIRKLMEARLETAASMTARAIVLDAQASTRGQGG